MFERLNVLIDDNIFDATVRNFYDADKSSGTQPQQHEKKQHTLNIIVRKDKLKSDLADFHHASMFSLVRSTLVRSTFLKIITTVLVNFQVRHIN